MGIRTKLKPQSAIHLKYSSDVASRAFAGSGEKKSRRLNPFHRGSAFFGEAIVASCKASVVNEVASALSLAAAMAVTAAVPATVAATFVAVV